MKKTVLFIAAYCSIAMASAQKRVLIEQFTNSGCPPCATYTPPISAYVQEHPDKAIMIAYHTSFPYLDSMYHENKAESDASVSFNAIQAVPQTVVDGIVYNGSSANFVSQKERIIDNRLSQATQYEISWVDVQLSNNTITGSTQVKALDSALQNTVLKLVVVEEKVLKSSYQKSPGKNTETEYLYVMRKMLPDFSGTPLNGTEQTIPFSWELAHIKDISQLRIIAFVQNSMTKEVYQADLIIPEGITSSIPSLNTSLENLSLYPNPAQETITIQSPTGLERIDILNAEGKLLRSQLGGNSLSVADLPAGFYLLKAISNTGQLQVQRFIKN